MGTILKVKHPYLGIKNYFCKKSLKIPCFSSLFDIQSVDFLEKLNAHIKLLQMKLLTIL